MGNITNVEILRMFWLKIIFFAFALKYNSGFPRYIVVAKVENTMPTIAIKDCEFASALTVKLLLTKPEVKGKPMSAKEKIMEATVRVLSL